LCCRFVPFSSPTDSAMADSESEEEPKQAAPAAAEEEAPAPEGAVIAGDEENADGEAEKAEATETAKKEEEVPDEQKASQGLVSGSLKPSYTLHFRNLKTEEVDLDELKMRLARFGEVVSVEQEGELVVAKFSRTNEAYEAHKKLTITNPFGADVVIEFGPQDSSHYNRGKRQGRGRPEPDGSGPGNNKGRGMRAYTGGSKEEDNKVEPKRKAEDDEVEVPGAKRLKKDGPADAAGSLTAPTKAVSRWGDSLTFEEQLEDFMKMPRRGMYNRYLVLGKLPPELRTGENIWRLMQPVQRDIIQVEMLTCFGKPVAHVTLRSATAAAAMHRLCEQHHGNLTVAFAPPRKASLTLWLGNVDDFVPRKSLEGLLNQYGKVIHGLRYLPSRTCSFATFTEVSHAVAARNHLYGLEVQKNQYLNIDFVDEADGMAAPPEAWGMWGAPPWGGAPPPWGMPPAPWGPRPPPGVVPWGHPPPVPGWRSGPRTNKDDRDHWRNSNDGGASGARLVERGAKQRRSRHESRSRSRGQEAESEQPKARRKEGKKAPPREEASEQPAAKAKVKLFKMGEFCCNIVANFVKGKESKEGAESLTQKLQIDQRTKIDHCRAHMERAGPLATVWHFSAADRKDCAAYDALCDYFVEKQRVGLVQTPSYYVYIVPPTEKYLKELNLPNSNFVVGLQIPIKK